MSIKDLCPKGARMFFKIDDEVKTVDISEETAERCAWASFARKTNTKGFFTEAYWYAQEKGDDELTEKRLNEYLDSLGIPQDACLKDITFSVETVKITSD